MENILLTITIILLLLDFAYLFYMGKIDNAYWIHFHKKYGTLCNSYRVPMKFYSNFDYHFFLYNKSGEVLDGARTKREAIKKHKNTGLFIVKVNETH